MWSVRNGPGGRGWRARSILPTLACTALLVSPAARADPAPGSTTAWSGAAVVARLQTGGLALDGVTVSGDISLTETTPVTHAFSCLNCQIRGRILAHDVTFAAAVDLSGSTVEGAADFRRATFEGAAAFGPTDRSTTFASAADFSLARFEDAAIFDQARFLGSGDFTRARFLSDVTFAVSTFCGRGTFVRSLFLSNADFGSSRFVRADNPDCAPETAMTASAAAQPARADFQGARFVRDAQFGSATFAGETDFLRSRFDGDVTFVSAHFRAAVGYPVTFEQTRFARGVSFDLAEFLGRAELSRISSDDVVSFRESVFEGPADQLLFADVEVPGVAMAVPEALRHVREEDRQRVLRLIEADAKSRNDLGTANDARYELETLRSRETGGISGFARSLLYGAVAGYFVRPWHPIVALGVGLAAFSLLAVVSRGDSRRRPIRVHLRRFPGALARHVGLIVGARGRDDEHASTAERVAVFGYRALLVLVLIALANSDPTLREMFDALV